MTIIIILIFLLAYPRIWLIVPSDRSHIQKLISLYLWKSPALWGAFLSGTCTCLCPMWLQRRSHNTCNAKRSINQQIKPNYILLVHSRIRSLCRSRPLFNTSNHQDVTKQKQPALLPRRLTREHGNQVKEQERAFRRDQIRYSLDNDLEFAQRRLPLAILKSLAFLAIQMHQDVVHQPVCFLQQTLVGMLTVSVLNQSWQDKFIATKKEDQLYASFVKCQSLYPLGKLLNGLN